MLLFLAAIRSASPETPAPPPATPAPAPTPDLIRDVAPPVDYFPYPTWMVVVACVLLAALLGVAVFFLVEWLRRPKQVIPPLPRAVAREALERLRAQVQTLAPYAFSIAVSEVLRKYIEAQYRVPALEQTTPEFLAAIAQDQHFSAAERQLLANFLESVDAIKFAGATGDASVNEALLEKAFDFVKGGTL